MSYAYCILHPSPQTTRPRWVDQRTPVGSFKTRMPMLLRPTCGAFVRRKSTFGHGPKLCAESPPYPVRRSAVHGQRSEGKTPKNRNGHAGWNAGRCPRKRSITSPYCPSKGSRSARDIWQRGDVMDFKSVKSPPSTPTGKSQITNLGTEREPPRRVAHPLPPLLPCAGVRPACRGFFLPHQPTTVWAFSLEQSCRTGSPTKSAPRPQSLPPC